MEETREALLLRLPSDLKERLEISARENRRSTTREVQVALELYLAPELKAR
jgi:hypothetical protein